MPSSHDIVVVGGSCGGLEAFREIVKQLPADFPAALFFVLHIPSEGASYLPDILTRSGKLGALHPKDRERIRPGVIYVAPPDHHLLLHQGYIRVFRGPRENRNRPAIDPLFRTAARSYRERVIGIVLSGMLDDGSAGLRTIKQQGGITVVQDPEDAFCSAMPRNAIENVKPHYKLPAEEIAALLRRLVSEPVSHKVAGSPIGLEVESKIAELDMATIENEENPGVPSAFACPECHGVLWEINDGEMLRFRCRVGHAYTASTLLEEQLSAIEGSLWEGLRALEESASLARNMSTQSKVGSRIANRYLEDAESKEQHASALREMLLKVNERNGKEAKSA